MTWRKAAALSLAQKALLTVTAVMVVCAPLLLGAARAMTPPTLGPAAGQQGHLETEEEHLRHTPLINPADFKKYAGYYQYADWRFYQYADFPIVLECIGKVTAITCRILDRRQWSSCLMGSTRCTANSLPESDTNSIFSSWVLTATPGKWL